MAAYDLVTLGGDSHSLYVDTLDEFQIIIKITVAC